MTSRTKKHDSNDGEDLMIICKVCGHIHFGNNAPETCPVCHAKAAAFKDAGDAVKTPANPSELTEAEQKHIPVITVQKFGGNEIINVVVGDIEHPMADDHWIKFIDLYVGEEFQVRTAFKAGTNLSPLIETLWNDDKTEQIKAVAACNKHGHWIASYERVSKANAVYTCGTCGKSSTKRENLC